MSILLYHNPVFALKVGFSWTIQTSARLNAMFMLIVCRFWKACKGSNPRFRS